MRCLDVVRMVMAQWLDQVQVRIRSDRPERHWRGPVTMTTDVIDEGGLHLIDGEPRK